jgi:hypothetical protein
MTKEKTKAGMAKRKDNRNCEIKRQKKLLKGRVKESF